MDIFFSSGKLINNFVFLLVFFFFIKVNKFLDILSLFILENFKGKIMCCVDNV